MQAIRTTKKHTGGLWRCVSAMLLMLLSFPAQSAPVSVSANAGSPDFAEAVSYRIYWNGIRIGKMHLRWQETTTHYEAEFTLETSGIVRIFSKQKRTASVSGTIRREDDSTTYTPERFHYHVKYRRKERSSEILFDEVGNITHYTVTPPDNRDTRPEVPPLDRNAAYDPLTASRALYGGVLDLAAFGAPDMRFSIFDGRRLTGVALAPAQERKECEAHCFRFLFTRSLLAGFTAKEKRKHKETPDPAVYVDIIPSLSRLPYRAHVQTRLGLVSAERVGN